MRVGIDARLLQGDFTGDRTYWRGLIRGLARLETDDQYALYTFPKMHPVEHDEAGGLRTRPVPAMCWRTWSLWAFPRALRADRVHLAHVQYSIPPVAPCPVVTSVHDISFTRCPEYFRFKDKFLLDRSMRYAAKHAARILALSEYTKNEMMEAYGVKAEWIQVVYPGVDEQYKPLDRAEARRFVAERYSIDFPYILAVGVIQPRKNLPRLLEGLSILKGISGLGHKLVVVGKYGWKESNLPAQTQELGLADDVVFTGYVPYEDLPSLYASADVFAYPSVYEGFGLPPLEAMACGTPVITGNRTSLPEVVGDAGTMVDPYDPEAFAQALRNVLYSDALRKDMSARGLERAKLFSWDRTAQEVRAVYSQVFNERETHG